MYAQADIWGSEGFSKLETTVEKDKKRKVMQGMRFHFVQIIRKLLKVCLFNCRVETCQWTDSHVEESTKGASEIPTEKQKL